jgi:hypothetical protein
VTEQLDIDDDGGDGGIDSRYMGTFFWFYVTATQIVNSNVPAFVIPGPPFVGTVTTTGDTIVLTFYRGLTFVDAVTYKGTATNNSRTLTVLNPTRDSVFVFGKK